jgi:hypothetical protein
MKALIKLAVIVVAVMPGLANSDEPNQELESLVRVADKLMAEDHRRAVKKLVVLPGASPASGAVTGSYQEETDGLLDGVEKGREIGVFRKDIGGIPISFPIPILTVPGMIFGGLSGTIKRQIQDFRDALTDDLAASAESPLSNDALATDVFWRLRDVSGLSPKVFALTTPIPEDTDAILYVSFSDSSIEVDGKVANWTADENAAWRDYANYARHYVGREIVAELFERVLVQQVLLPEESETVSRIKKDRWRGVTRSRTPTLAWGLSLEDKGQQVSWAKTIGETDISYDVEIYDMHQLVYSANNVAGQQHMVDIELDDCKTYRWSVRPSFKVDGAERYGEWMRSNPDAANGNAGKVASEAAAYIYDFASLEIKCIRR